MAPRDSDHPDGKAQRHFHREIHLAICDTLVSISKAATCGYKRSLSDGLVVSCGLLIIGPLIFTSLRLDEILAGLGR